MTTAELQRTRQALERNPIEALEPLLEFLQWLEENKASEQSEPTFLSFLKNPSFWINFAKVAWFFVRRLILKA